MPGASPVDAPDQLAADHAERVAVVGEPCPRRPDGGLGGEPLGERRLIEQLLDRERRLEARDTCGVRENVPDENSRLPGGTELRPIPSNRVVEVELAAFR